MTVGSSRVRHTLSEDYEFQFPFNELMLWAVLTKRQAMARCMWQHGEEPMAKALIAVRLYRAMAREAANDYLEVEICNELRTFAEFVCVLERESDSSYSGNFGVCQSNCLNIATRRTTHIPCSY
jgi:hypothetical protein